MNAPKAIFSWGNQEKLLVYDYEAASTKLGHWRRKATENPNSTSTGRSP